MTQPTVAFTDGATWRICYPYSAVSGTWRREPMPPVSCPVVNLDGTDDEAVFAVLTRYRVRYPGPIRDLGGMLAALEQIGASVSYPVRIEQPAEVA